MIGTKSIKFGRRITHIREIKLRSYTLKDVKVREIMNHDHKYLITDCGKVISFGRYKSGQILKTHVSSTGYEMVKLSLKGRTCNWSIHRLVALAFIPDEDSGLLEVHHIDEDKLNNKVSNLMWVTRSSNIQYSVAKYRGENKNFSKITEELAGKIKWYLSNTPLSQYKIADKLGTTRSTVCHIKAGNSWCWVEPVKP